ncbi:hypothetical protein Pfl01_1361 [Pseudomonas fluorescens Pf0-1]|uniref:Uncharacterized protein n=1 Tax=Pseudomonas fluorescens (strain Pf0-1) TaxID=205922 RepID=Q3KGK2_PSEPF|nr:hypothetical protein Pfl01_1361 [Pseudomonas fluorescens Pf0-1]
MARTKNAARDEPAARIILSSARRQEPNRRFRIEADTVPCFGQLSIDLEPLAKVPNIYRRAAPALCNRERKKRVSSAIQSLFPKTAEKNFRQSVGIFPSR